MTMFPTIQNWLKALQSYLSKLTTRERLLISLAGFAAASIGVIQVFGAVSEEFAIQERALARAKSEQQEVLEKLARYSQLKVRREAVEERFKEVEIKEGVRSQIENLMRTKANVTGGYTIKDGPVSEFGGNYELAPFSVRFTVQSLPGLVAFLEELVHGPRPLVLSELDLKRPRTGERIDVSLEVSSIRKIK